MKWSATIMGQPRSKANSRINLRSGRSIKNPDVLEWVESVKAQALACRPTRMLEGRLSVSGTFYYPNDRSDLDPSAFIDALQGIVLKNDKQVKHWDIWHDIDRRPKMARVEIVVSEIEEPHK